jgi:ribosomal protein S18 acetylase RimI-like enzyme
MPFNIKISFNPKLEDKVQDATSLGRYLGKEYYSFYADEGNIMDVYSLESNSGAIDIWSLPELRKIANFTSVNLLVIYRYTLPLGYLAYTLKKGRISLWSVTIHPEYRMQGLGAKVIRWLASEYDMYDMATTVRESDLGSQIFLRQTNFMCTRTLKETFSSPEEDGYFFTRLADSLR